MRVVRGDRPPRPSLPNGDTISDIVWSLIQSCWDHDAICRPSAGAIAITLPIPGKTRLKIMIEQYLDRLQSVVQRRMQQLGQVGASVVLAASNYFIDFV